MCPHCTFTQNLLTTHTYLTFAFSLINTDGRNAAVDPCWGRVIHQTLRASFPFWPRPYRKGLGTKAGNNLHMIYRLLSTVPSLTMLRESVGVIVLFAVLNSAALQYDPKPNPGSVVEVGQARFTVLTSNLIRMEWGGTNDAATFAFINRNLPTPQFSTSKDGDWTVIQTTAVKVRLC